MHTADRTPVFLPAGRAAVSRRQFLRAAVGAGVGVALNSLGLGAQGPGDSEANRGSRIKWGRLKFRGNGGQQIWSVYPEADLNVIKRIRDVTSADLDFDWRIADIDNLKQMAEFPWLFMNEQNLPIFTDAQRANLREYLRRGGFLYIDDCVLSPAQPEMFFRAMRFTEFPKILPGARMVNFDENKKHDLFHCVYQLPGGTPYVQGVNRGTWGVYDQDRLVALLTSTDLHCAWAGLLDKTKEEAALRMGVNLYVYAMTH